MATEAYDANDEEARRTMEALEKNHARSALASEKVAVRAGEIAKDTRAGGRNR